MLNRYHLIALTGVSTNISGQVPLYINGSANIFTKSAAQLARSIKPERCRSPRALHVLAIGFLYSPGASLP